MKKKNFKVKKFGEPKVVHESKPVDLITQFNRLRSIAADIYNSDFFAIATKKERKEINASIEHISATMISIIGMEAIKNSHDSLPDDSGNGDDYSYDNLPDDSGDDDRSWYDDLPDDSGDDTDTDKERHDAIKKMKNIVYGETKSDAVKKAAARQVLNSVYGAPSSIVAMNRKILSELGVKSHADKPDEDQPFSSILRSIALGNEYDEITDDDSDSDEVKDYSEVNLGNFIDGQSYGQRYRDICRQYGFDMNNTLKQIEKLASQQYIQMINLVDAVDSQDEITADKYTLEPGSVFFVTNKNDESRSPVFMLIYAQPYTKVKSSDISKFSFEIAPAEVEESTKTNDIEFIGSDAYYDIGKVHLSQNTVIDLDATLEKIKDEARKHGISTITFVHTIGNSLDIFTEGKYTLESGVLFYHRGNEWLNFMLVVEDEDIPDKVCVCIINPVEKPEENSNLDDIEFIGIDAYYNIDTTFTDPNYVINLDATLRKIKEKAKEKGIKTITFVDTIEEHEDLYADGKYSLEPGSLFFVKEGYLRFILISENPTTCQYIDLAITKKNDSEEDSSESKEDDIEFIGSDAYYSIDNTNPNYTIDLDATLIKIKEMARAKNIKTVTFVGIIKGHHEAYYKGNNSQVGSLYYLKNDERPMFILITGNIDYVNLPMHEDIDPVVVIKKDDPEGESDSKEDGIEAVEAEDNETAVIDPHKSLSCKSSIIDRCISNQYANVDTSEMSCDDYLKLSFPIFMKPTMSGKNVNFVDICDIYNFDVSETIKRIKNVAYLAEVGAINYVGTIDSNYEIFRETANGGYLYDNGSLFLMTNCTDAEKSPYFVILRKLWDANISQYIFTPYRVNPIMKSAKINSVEEIDVIDKYADGNVRIREKLEDIISIYFDYKIREICEERNYDFNKMISCIMGVVAIIGGGSTSTFEGTVDSINSIISVDPMVAYSTCSIFFVNDKKEPYFVIYMPITGKTKSGHNFRLYRIRPIHKQYPNTDSQDDSNIREINQFTSIYRADSEVNGADKDVYMKKVEFSNINYSDGVNQSFASICNDWKFNGYDTINRIKLVAYVNNFEEIKFAGTVCSHEEISEKEVLYDYGSVLFISDAEDPHFVIIEYISGITWLDRINPVKE